MLGAIFASEYGVVQLRCSIYMSLKVYLTTTVHYALNFHASKLSYTTFHKNHLITISYRQPLPVSQSKQEVT